MPYHSSLDGRAEPILGFRQDRCWSAALGLNDTSKKQTIVMIGDEFFIDPLLSWRSSISRWIPVLMLPANGI